MKARASQLTIDRHGSTATSFTVYNTRVSPRAAVVVDALVLVLIAMCALTTWPTIPSQADVVQLQRSYWPRWIAATIAIAYIRARTSTVLYESILVTRGLGVQLCTTRGIVLPIKAKRMPQPTVVGTNSTERNTSFEPEFKTIKLSTSRSFLSVPCISDVIINEAIWRWQVVYYLVIVVDEARQRGIDLRDGPTTTPIKLKIAFPELLPRLDIVKRVWIGVRHALFDELSENEIVCDQLL
ncbi:hypothetical protein OIV83_003937 [Microbotryomycetes sp. JL201]|nr:hypothetical protein OIV83_003937 [Microbotryomycetes sp. JL201]